MEILKNGFWDYASRWRETFKQSRDLIWADDWLKNDYCGDCRFCCGPQDSDIPFPMPLLSRQKRPDLEDDFYLLDELTPYLGKAGCKSCGSKGCRLQIEQKPIACGLFPVVLANGGLYLYQNCPAVVFSPLARFLELAKPIATTLDKLDLDDLRRLSLWLDLETLARNYINLRIQLFDEHGKKLIFS